MLHRDRFASNTQHRLTHGGMIAAVAVFVCCLVLIGTAHGQPHAVRIDLTLRETLSADTPESEIVDSTSVPARFDQETTLRVGNMVVYVTARPVDDHSLRLLYSIFATGPIPGQWGNETTVEYGTPVIVDDITGKGKSNFRMLLTPQPLDSVPPGMVLPTEDGAWRVVPSAYYQFHLSDRSLAIHHFTELRNALEYEFEGIKDTLGFEAPGRVDYFFVDGPCLDVPADPRLDYQVDPSRNRVVARHDPLYTGVDVTGTFLLKAYRWWGYAPELLALGVSGYSTFADFYVKRDRRDGQVIALRDLVRSIDFKRQPFPASFNHAASFVKWLIHRYGVDRFRELYGKATDLSFERAMFSVYNQTLEEMERSWLAYLNERTFDANEYYGYAKRAAAYHHYTDHHELLQLTIASRETVPASMLRQMTLAAAQLGKWPEAVEYAYQAAEETPTDPQALSLLGEVQWAVGDLDGTRYHLNQVIHLDSTDARPYVTLGDLEAAERRQDAAAALWETGLAKSVERDPTAVELLLRLGRNMRTHRNRDSAQVLFTEALNAARALIPKQPGDIRPITRMGETLMELDSLDQALAYLETAAYVADAPQEMGRIYIDIGRCHDLAGRRKMAVDAYEAVFQIPATYYHERLARRYVNSIYTH